MCVREAPTTMTLLRWAMKASTIGQISEPPTCVHKASALDIKPIIMRPVFAPPTDQPDQPNRMRRARRYPVLSDILSFSLSFIFYVSLSFYIFSMHLKLG